MQYSYVCFFPPFLFWHLHDLAKAVDQHECEVLQRDAQIAEFKTILREKVRVVVILVISLNTRWVRLRYSLFLLLVMYDRCCVLLASKIYVMGNGGACLYSLGLFLSNHHSHCPLILWNWYITSYDMPVQNDMTWGGFHSPFLGLSDWRFERHSTRGEGTVARRVCGLGGGYRNTHASVEFPLLFKRWVKWWISFIACESL